MSARTLAVASLFLFACAHERVTVKTVSAPSGGTAYVISCEDDAALCEAEARRLCPRERHTIDAGRSGYYAENVDPEGPAAHPQSKPFPGARFRETGWIVQCEQVR